MSKTHYIKKGYAFTFLGDEFEVPVQHLPQNSNVKIEVVCDYCKKKFKKQYGKFLNQRESSPIKKDACKICHPLKTKESSLLKFGVDHYTKLPYEAEKIGQRKRLELKFIENEFFKKNLILLETQYENSQQILEYLCLKHIDKGIQRGSWSNIKNQLGCGHCGNEQGAKKQRKSFMDIEKKCKEIDFILLTKEEDYVNKKSPLEVICINHIENGSFITYFDCFRYSQGCKQCYIERNKGENHYKWKGGITSIRDFLRKQTKSWKLDSLKACNYECVITNNTAEVIHHLYSFEYLIDIVFKETNLNVKEKFTEYTEQELKILGDKVKEVHYRFGLGVALTRSIHLLFHKIYGLSYTTPEQFQEFKLLYFSKIINNTS